MRIIDTLILPALLIACGVKLPDDQDPNDTSGEAAGSSGESASSTPTSGDSAATDGTLDPPPGTMGASSTSQPTGVTEGETGDTEVEGEVDSTTVPVGPCEAMCEQAGSCGLREDVAGCVAQCLDAIDDLSGACQAAAWESTQCFAGLECEFLAKALADEGGHPCQGAVLEQETACGPPRCFWAVGGDQRGTSCSLFVECPGDPTREMQCDTQTCMCLEGGVMTGSCAAEGVCDDLNTVHERGPACCGFPEVGG